MAVASNASARRSASWCQKGCRFALEADAACRGRSLTPMEIARLMIVLYEDKAQHLPRKVLGMDALHRR